ncbi:hypothetical protein FWH09_01305 [Candidatus Saccharibacteria bacterium]|nr:hypothetical protein [Candidatus Saccharibacteria bacterium]
MNWEPIVITGIICFTIIAVAGIMTGAQNAECENCEVPKKKVAKKGSKK